MRKQPGSRPAVDPDGALPPVSRRTVAVVALCAAVCAAAVGVFITPTGFTEATLAPQVLQYREVEPQITIDGYRFNEDVQQVTVWGATTLPAGAVVVVDVGAVERGGVGTAAGQREEASAAVTPEGTFEAKVPVARLGAAPALAARAAFDPRWAPNAALRPVYGDTGEHLWGRSVISDGVARQLYDDQLLFREPILVSR